ncbi:MAG TPA: sigma-70 family RNA polymerase sigma factor [Bryobacteraceae bacterium]|nr:sigma-70 family RNA polymerase sigma factor [Bryobacteraceae bacterium]
MALRDHPGEDTNPLPLNADDARTAENEANNSENRGTAENSRAESGGLELGTREVRGAEIVAGEIGFEEAPREESLGPHPDLDIYAGWVDLVERIRSSETDGLTELYLLFSKGIRFYLCRQLGPQELDDKVHDTFVVVVQAIRRGELREPQRLMGFVRTIVRRQVAAHIDKVVHSRRDQMDMESTVRVADPRGSPEDAAIFRQRNELIQRVLDELGKRDREILTRFYLHEQSQEQICIEMSLTETQFRLLKSRAKARFGELGKKKLATRASAPFSMRTSAGISH